MVAAVRVDLTVDVVVVGGGGEDDEYVLHQIVEGKTLQILIQRGEAPAAGARFHDLQMSCKCQTCLESANLIALELVEI